MFALTVPFYYNREPIATATTTGLCSSVTGWHHDGMAANTPADDLRPWVALGRAVLTRRVELGYRTRGQFAEAAGLTIKTLGEIERGERASYDRSTLAQVEKTLQWRPGVIRQAVESGLTSDGELLVSPSSDPSELSTPEGIARYVYRDDLPLVALLHRAALPDAALFRLILHVRAARERDNARLLEDVADRVRAAGGWAPEQPYPPTWLGDG